MKKFVNMLSFIALVCIALSLILAKVIPSIAGACNTIGSIIAYLVVSIYAFMFVKSKRNIWWMITYIVAVILVVTFLILA